MGRRCFSAQAMLHCSPFRQGLRGPINGRDDEKDMEGVEEEEKEERGGEQAIQHVNKITCKRMHTIAK